MYDLNKQNVWVTSDPHYNHKNICRGESEWQESNKEKSTRDFATVKDMNQALVNGINDYVKKEDILFCLGDWSFGGIESIGDFRSKINCEIIHLIYGNHDHHLEDPYKVVYQNLKSKDLFESLQYVKTITVKLGDKKYQIFMSHYAHLVWDKSHKGALHLFGHSHTSINHLAVGRSQDCGVDNAFLKFGEYRPFNLATEIIPVLLSKPIAKVDHH